jgi:hypothetical protein
MFDEKTAAVTPKYCPVNGGATLAVRPDKGLQGSFTLVDKRLVNDLTKVLGEGFGTLRSVCSYRLWYCR